MTNQGSREHEDSSGEDIPIHPLISRMMTNRRMMTNGEPIDSTIIIEGFVGPAGQDENIRIYFDLTFSSYFEIAKVDVLHVESNNADDENKPTKIWIKRSARIEIVTVQRVSTEATFLDGSLTNRLRPFQLRSDSSDLAPRTNMVCTRIGCGNSLDECGTSYSNGCYFPSDKGCHDTLYGNGCGGGDHDPCTWGFPITVGRSPAKPC